MRIDQRYSGASVTVPTNGNYTVDRYACLASLTSKYSIQQNAGAIAPPSGYSNYVGATSLSAYAITSTDYFGIEQRIEGLNISDLGWGGVGASSVTLSFWVRSSLTGTFGGAINNAVNRSYPFAYTISNANTWEQKAITIPGDATGTWLTTNGIGLRVILSFGAGSTFAGSAGAWVAGNLVSATGATSVVGTNGATFYVTGVQLETGTVATPFERRSYGQELALCQRYYEVGEGYVGGYAQAAGSGVYHYIPWKATKRAVPTLGYSVGGVVNASVFDIRNASVHGGLWYSTGTGAGQIAWNGAWTAAIEL